METKVRIEKIFKAITVDTVSLADGGNPFLKLEPMSR
jgi:hypothetical protein